MTIERTTVVGLLTTFLLVAAHATGQDFNERYAAWQGRAPAAQRLAAPADLTQDVGGAMELTPSAAPARSQRILSDAYTAPQHTPDYNRPMTTSGCSSCSHGPTYLPNSDPLGTCDFGGGMGACGSCGPGGCFGGSGACGPCGACGGAGGGCDWGDLCANPQVWARFEVLLWWRQGRDYPVLVTSDPTTEASTTAGILPDAQTLFGGGRVGTNVQAGGRIDFGFFVNPTQCFGIGDRVWGLGKDASNFNVNSNNVPVLAIPFRDLSTGDNEALLVAYPGLRRGSINVSGTSSVFGNDVYGRILLCRDCETRLDFITGWNYTRVVDDVKILSSSTVTQQGGSIPQGTVLTTQDQFNVRNDFNGAIFGLQWERNCGYWSSQALARVSIGNMRESIEISGESRVNGTLVTNPVGGVFTRPSNIGHFSRNEFTAITELGYNLSYRFNPCTQLTVGYSLIYWNDIMTGGAAIDTTVGAAGGTTRPQVVFDRSDFWVQGLNLGITRQF